MDITTITDKKELAYMLVQQQRVLAQAQQNCQLLEQRLEQLEQAEAAEAAEANAALDEGREQAKAKDKA